jgi:hypothetical protein
MGELKIEILVPVNPIGKSFIKKIYGGVTKSEPEIIKYYKKELSKMTVKLGYKIWNTIGDGKFIKGKIIIEYDDQTKQPLKIYIRDLEIYDSPITYPYIISVESNKKLS